MATNFPPPTLPAGFSRDRQQGDFLKESFPDDFAWGSATSSYQIEGAHDADGKGPSVWDTFSHEPGRVECNHNGDVACDHYNHLEEDVQLIKNLGLKHYRFSISWCRILPTGDPSNVNQKGIDFYNRLLDCLAEAGISAMVTIYHWDMPQALGDKGGWMNAEIVDLFKEFARICFEQFGGKVKQWLTLNEPMVFALLGYGFGMHHPGQRDFFGKGCRVIHHLILAHAKVYHLYEASFKEKQNGRVGIALCSTWNEPRNPNSEEDRQAAERAMRVAMGWFAWPIFKTGDYPEEVKTGVAAVCEKNGIKSTLPEFTKEEMRLNKGTADFLGWNYYTTSLVWSPSEAEKVGPTPFSQVAQITGSVDPEWKRGKCMFFHVVPWGIRNMANWLTKTFPSVDIYITENGYSDEGQLDDSDRVDFFRNHLNELLKAIRLDGARVKGYYAWSLMDNFEWSNGYNVRFGMHHVDFTDPKRRRTKKASADFYKHLVQSNGFKENE
ncbi:hypothetical protein CAPTEDRAFT_149629 [Capitella teleta]|uniref:Beta-glucosidase n=1 Tax=Capitella teleta TaxID=283909 RepID=R7TEG2_CAPTE|nr:hypothetical protein CAPTEDRAFT_149629 [Capitella teleta]|eukprot:ELT91862.1 hypothetical protein CAPTEDRAFT_149629 [Capitella teleta]